MFSRHFVAIYPLQDPKGANDHDKLAQLMAVPICIIAHRTDFTDNIPVHGRDFFVSLQRKHKKQQ
jgi:hypothetical protein